jgi:hypothetical protein
LGWGKTGRARGIRLYMAANRGSGSVRDFDAGRKKWPGLLN